MHGHEIFVDGAFNGDPHPGNFLLVQPGNKIGLIDYGQVKVLTRENRLVFARLIKALCDGDDERIAACMYVGGGGGGGRLTTSNHGRSLPQECGCSPRVSSQRRR